MGSAGKSRTYMFRLTAEKWRIFSDHHQAVLTLDPKWQFQPVIWFSKNGQAVYSVVRIGSHSNYPLARVGEGK